MHAVRPDGKDLVRLTDEVERADYPARHPDGKSLAYVAERAGRFDFYQLPLG